MPEFLTLLPPAEALEQFLNALAPRPGEETIATIDALGRVPARPVAAPEPLPAFPRSTVDGYAVRARDTFGASDGLPAYLAVVGEIAMGSAPAFLVGPGEAALIHTGGMLPGGADAVVMVEHTQQSRPGEVEVYRPLAAGENTLLTGEDVLAGQEVIPAGRSLNPAGIGVLMALGITRVTVSSLPIVGILSTGDEVIAPDQQPTSGQVRDINSYTLSALCAQHGALPVRYGILPDNPDALQAALADALARCDMVILTAGSSASTRDLTAQTIASFGPPGVLIHGVNMKPGKPTILGVCQNKAVIGLPGNPVSALVVGRLFVVPVIERLLGLVDAGPAGGVLSARLSVNLPSQAGREDWTPARLLPVAGGWRAEPIFYRSNLIFTLAQADGLIYTPSDAVGLEAGSIVRVELI